MQPPEFKFFFSKGRGLMSRFVAWWVRSKYLSHTVGSFKIFNADVIMESTDAGVDFTPAKTFAASNTVQAIVRPISGPLTTQEGISEHMTWLIENYGADSYDWMAAGSVGIRNRLRWLWNAIGGWLKSKWGKKSVQCTELWVLLLKHAQYETVMLIQPELSDPLALLRAMSRSVEFTVEKIDPGLQKEVDRTDG